MKKMHEQMPSPGRKLSKEKEELIIKNLREKLNDKLRLGQEGKKDEYPSQNQDSEFFVITTLERGEEKDDEEKKDVTHYIPKWDKIYDEELGWIPVEELIEATQKYYSQISSKEKSTTRETVKRLREEGFNKEEKE